MALLPAFVLRRPRVINVLHAMRLTRAQSNTSEEELECLARHARGHRCAVEIGTHMGVSAVMIAKAMHEDGILFCVDPWERRAHLENPSLLICRREFRRNGIAHKVRITRGTSAEVQHLLPANADFVFVDGDHSRHGIAADWGIVQTVLRAGGTACFHDTSPVPGSIDPPLDSVAYFRDVISNEMSFEHIETCGTLNVIRRRPAVA